jgi:hypothetical protein
LGFWLRLLAFLAAGGVYSSFYSPLLAPPTSSLFLLLRPSLSRDISLSLHASTGTVPCDALSTETRRYHVTFAHSPHPSRLGLLSFLPNSRPGSSGWLSSRAVAPRPAAGSRPLQFWWRLNLRTYTPRLQPHDRRVRRSQ